MIDVNKNDFEKKLNNGFRDSSYLAKICSKDNRDKYSCVFGSSQISPFKQNK